MKLIKLLAILILIFLAASLVSAAEKYYFKDFSLEPNQGIILEEGDVVEFSLLGADHFLRIKEISRDNNKIKLNIYPYKGQAQQVPFFGLDNVVYVDLNQDEWDDLALDIIEISEDRRVTLIAIALEQQSTEIPEGQGMVVTDTRSNYKRTFLFAGLLIIGLIGILAFRKSKDNPTETSEEKVVEETKEKDLEE
ncbi:MAG: hypothetical protein KKA65_05745 [Nanoarchaeota archaeon]|nr:hypothetical protein [Nanoarchaeota archaeon]MBU4456974.1 hypothetical protein [Nanoarchaeota archaeon]